MYIDFLTNSSQTSDVIPERKFSTIHIVFAKLLESANAPLDS